MVHLSRRKEAGELAHFGKVSLIDFRRQNPGLPCLASREAIARIGVLGLIRILFFNFLATLTGGKWRLIHSKKITMSDPRNQVLDWIHRLI